MNPKKTAHKLAIAGGTVIDPANSRSHRLTVFVEGGVIVEVSGRRPSEDEHILDAQGFIVTPGFIDMHVHLREPGYEYKEDIASGSRAAAAGGFTTVVCMPNTKPINDNAAVTRQIIKRAKEVAAVRVLCAGALSRKSEGRELADLEGMQREGVRVFSDDGGCIQDRVLMREALLLAKKLDALVVDHAEDLSLGGRESENVIIERDIELARETGARVHIAHLSTKEGVKAIREAKANGISISCEVTPHHLLLKEDDVKVYGANAIMKPPLRTEEDRQALIEGLADGTIDAIATDHAPHAPHEKADPKMAAFGVIGMETMLPVCLKLVHEERITMERFIDAITAAPARIIGLDGGRLSLGMPADITIFDPAEDIVIDSSRFLSKSRNTPFNGWKLKGRVATTLVQGSVVYKP